MLERGKCFAENDKNKCGILKSYIKKDCENCPFFKTKDQFEKDREETLRRLRTLDKTTRRSIAERYKIKGV